MKKEIQMANEGGDILLRDRGVGANPTDTICMANESRFIEDTFSEPLTTFAVGWKDGGKLQELLDFIAPEVPVSRRFEYMTWTNAEEFQAESNAEDVRAIGAEFKRVEYTSHKANGATVNKGLTVRVDLDNVDGIPNWREITTARLMRRLLRAEVLRAYALLVGIATDTAKTWDTTDGKDPDQDIASLVLNFGDASGMNPNKVLYGLASWNNRRIAHRAQKSAGGFSSAGMTIDEVAVQVGVEQGFVSSERYQTGANTKSRVVGDKVLIFLGENQASLEDPSNIKRFVSKTQGGTAFRVYEQQVTMKLVDISVEHYANTVVTSSLGVQSCTVNGG